MTGLTRPPGAPQELDVLRHRQSNLYMPAPGRYLEVNGHRMHYLDCGAGEPVVMLHGNPTWCIYYRSLLQALAYQYRCIVPDHIGCGYSDKPADAAYEYTLQRRVDDLERLLVHLNLKEPITLVLHDWGGMIGMAYAARYPESIRRLILFNTAAFKMPQGKRFPWLLRLARANPWGPLLVRGFNAFSRGTLRIGCRRKRMPGVLRAAYRAPYDSWGRRIAVLRFVQDIPLAPGDRAYDIVDSVERSLHQFRDTPALLCWGMRDFVFDHHFLRRWAELLPHAEVHRFEDAGHLVLEDAQDQIIPLVRDFLRRT